jgi:hypothetical protein
MVVASVGPNVILVVAALPVTIIMQEVIHSLCAISISFYILSLNNTKQTLVISVYIQLKIQSNITYMYLSFCNALSICHV